MKYRLTGTSIGQMILGARRVVAFRTMSLRNPEQAGIQANHIISDRLIAQICPPGGTFLDVGAQYGSVFAAARRHDPTLKVIAFEAEPQKAAQLMRAFPNCQVFDVAVGEKKGTATFFRNLKASGYDSLLPSNEGEMRQIEVPVAALDDLLPETTVDVIKIDIEGAELGALRGGAKLIENSKPVVMFECVLRGTNALGYSPSLIWHWFNDRGFEIFTPDRLAHTAPGLVHDAFLDAQEYPFRSHNYFAVHKDRVEKIRDQARMILGICQ